MDVRIVLLPEEKLDKVSKEYSQKLTQKFSTLFTLDDTHIPHVTIVHVKSKNFDLAKLQEKIKQVIERTSALSMEVGSPRKGGYPGYVGIGFSPSSPFEKLRSELVLALRVEELGDLNQPHVTLTRLAPAEKEDGALDIISDFPKAEFSFPNLAICKPGENGTCVKILAQFSLKSL